MVRAFSIPCGIAATLLLSLVLAGSRSLSVRAEPAPPVPLLVDREAAETLILERLNKRGNLAAEETSLPEVIRSLSELDPT